MLLCYVCFFFFLMLSLLFLIFNYVFFFFICACMLHSLYQTRISLKLTTVEGWWLAQQMCFSCLFCSISVGQICVICLSILPSYASIEFILPIDLFLCLSIYKYLFCSVYLLISVCMYLFTHVCFCLYMYVDVSMYISI